MHASPHILSIDLGTGGPKVSLVGRDGAIAASTLRPVATHGVGDGGYEQDPEEIWTAILDACRQVVHEASVPRASVLGVTCASQFFSLVPIDAAGRPVSDLILWMDVRGGPHTLAMYGAHPDAMGRWLEVNGMLPLPSGNDSLSHALFLREERPRVYERAHKLVEPGDYVTTRLSGVCASNPCTAFAQLLTDNRRLDAVAYAEELIGLSGIDRAKLPELVASNQCVGTVTPEVAAEIGLEPGTRVFAAVNDTQAVSIGAGVFQGGGGINIGTTCQVLAFLDAMKSDPRRGMLSMPSPIPGRYAVMSECGLGAKPLEHFLTQVVFASDALADHATADPFANLEKLVGSVPPGSGGLLYLPWLTGANAPRVSARMRGGFLNLGLETTRAQMLRAVLEGVSLHLRWVLPEVERFTGQAFDELRFSGGGAVSDEWSQMLADVMDRPVLQLAEARYVNNRATALLAFEQLGLSSLDEIQRLCPVRRRYEPRPPSRDLYRERFDRFVEAFERTEPLFEALNG